MIKIFKWDALYKDKKVFSQYAEDGTERMFNEIDQDNVVSFGITNGEHHIVANLEKGKLIIDNIPFEFPDFSNKDVDYRLIYFRRVQRSIGTAPGMEGNTTESYVGFQFTEDDINKKIMVSIADSGLLSYKLHIK